MISKILTESTNDGLVRLDGIFFSNGRCGNRSRFLRLLRLSWCASFCILVWHLGHPYSKRYDSQTVSAMILETSWFVILASCNISYRITTRSSENQKNMQYEPDSTIFITWLPQSGLQPSKRILPSYGNFCGYWKSVITSWSCMIFAYTETHKGGSGGKR